MILRKMLVIAPVLILAACARAPVVPTSASIPSADQLASCISFYKAFDDAVMLRGLRDGGAAPIHGFPCLRTDRFLSSYRHTHLSGEAFEAWMDRLASLDLEGRKIELGNLPAGDRQALLPAIPQERGSDRDLISALRFCTRLLRNQHLATKADRSLLQQRAVVPQDYNSWKRFIGVYALTRMPVAFGLHRWHKRTVAKFRESPDSLLVHGTLIRFSPSPSERFKSAIQVAELLRRSSRNPLGIPEPDQAQHERLFATFAPVFEVDVVSNDDRIGAPYWPESGVNPSVDTASPVVYQRISHARFKGRPLLQLNYIIWFPARTCTSAVDILCGRMDGINWRVTLSSDGEPLIYDSIHNCGCYHLFFPSGRLHPRQLDTLDETAFVPQQAPELKPHERLVIRIAAVSHHIEAVYAGQANDSVQEAYAWADYSELRSLPRRDGSRQSLFQADGLVPGTARKERWLLWPMGVASPGSMRQWGRHATAFVGRRHFDDPCLIEANFLAAGADASSGTANKRIPNHTFCNGKSRP